MNLVVLSLPGSERQADALGTEIGALRGEVEFRAFPDGESYVRILSSVSGRDVAIVCSLDRPDPKLLPLCFLAQAARDQGARRIGLVASAFAKLLSGFVDWLVTVDPHLHRRSSLDEIYSIPSRVLHAAPATSAWIRDQVPNPVLIGPDEESRQWVEAIANAAGAPFVVLRKQRHGDRDVEVSAPDLDAHKGRTPVLPDDIISTGRTMIETLHRLRAIGLTRAVCVGVHAVFADGAYEQLLRAGASRIVTSDAIAHPSNGIELAPLIAEGVSALLDASPSLRGVSP